jgi:hypothetical protein
MMQKKWGRSGGCSVSDKIREQKLGPKIHCNTLTITRSLECTLPQTLFPTSGKRYILYLSKILARYYSYLFRCKYLLMILLSKKLSSQEGNFVFFGYPHPFLHYLLADLSMENLASLSQYYEVSKYPNPPLYSPDKEYW